MTMFSTIVSIILTTRFRDEINQQITPLISIRQAQGDLMHRHLVTPVTLVTAVTGVTSVTNCYKKKPPPGDLSKKLFTSREAVGLPHPAAADHHREVVHPVHQGDHDVVHPAPYHRL